MIDFEREQLKSEIGTLRLLLEVNEATALEQARLAEEALYALGAQAAEREREGQLVRELIEISNESVVVLDGEWRIRYMNGCAIEGVGGGVDRAGRKLLDVYPEMEQTPFYGYYRKAMLERIPLAFEEFYHPLEKWYSVRVAPVGDGIAFFFQDTTERRRRDTVLQRTEKLAAVGRLASSISHEINNPLESVVNLLYLIQNSDPGSPEVKEYTALASRELARVSHIVTQTLKFHRQLTWAAKCSVSETLDNVVSLYHGRMATRRVSVERRYAEDDTILCFAGDLRQVFANLIGNALDAITNDGRLTLRTRLGMEWRSGRHGVWVTVADNGCGMSEATQKGLFEAFFTTKPVTGTGLGLWVSEEIVRNHKGRIRVRSSQRRGASGTVFSLFFPTEGG